LQFPLRILKFTAKLSQVFSLFFQCAAYIIVLVNLSLEGFISFEIECFIDEHGEWLIREEEVFFFGAKNSSGV
jgi:hypothetical protein